MGPQFATPLAEDLAPVHDTAAYAAGEAIGPVQSLEVKTSFSSGDKGPIILTEQLVLSIPEALTPDIDIVIFDSAPTAVADHDAFDPSAADTAKIADVISVTGAQWKSFGTKRVAVRDALVKVARMKNPPTLYVLFIARSSVTFATPSTLKGKLAGFVN